MVRFLRYLAVVFLILMLAADAAADLPIPDRRKPQFQKEAGYYIFPSPYSIPGVGDGLAVVGLGMNLGGTYTDLFGFGLTGDMLGLGLGIIDVHLVPERLILDINAERFSKATMTSFSERGMNTAEHDYTLLEFDNFQFIGGRLTNTYFDRKFEVYGGGYLINSKLGGILDPEGNTILDVQDPQPWREQVYVIGTRFDLTDDYADPRRGLRLDAGRWWSPPKDQSDPDFYHMEYNATAYIPMGRISTWVFNYFRSDARVLRQGETDFTAIEQETGLNCSDLSLTPEEQQECIDVVNGIKAANTYGTAGSFGGTSRLRSYPNDRYKGAHAVFYGTEFRFNLTEEARPFDIFIAKDIRTVLQLAFFYELGSVEDERKRLGDIYRASYGAGFRMVTASGVVFRADVAAGREGFETTIIFGYPWEPL
jgi:hypothetical protein